MRSIPRNAQGPGPRASGRRPEGHSPVRLFIGAGVRGLKGCYLGRETSRKALGVVARPPFDVQSNSLGIILPTA